MLFNKHKWQYLQEYYHETFLGERVKNGWNKFRYCTKCGIVQEFNYDSQGGSWDVLSIEKMAIVLNYYNLPEVGTMGFEYEGMHEMLAK